MRSYCRARIVEKPSAPRRLFSIAPTARQAQWRAARSGNERTALLLLRFVRGARRSRQLQHGRVLAFAQPGEQNDLSVGKLQRVVVHRHLFHVDLPEPSYLSATFWFGKSEWRYSTSCSNAISVPGRTHTATFGSPTAANPRVKELSNLVEISLSPTFCRSGCDEIETVVAHRSHSPVANSRVCCPPV